MSGALRGMGKMTESSVVYLLSYYGLMLPAGYALAFHFGFGVKGIWRLASGKKTIAIIASESMAVQETSGTWPSQ